MSALERLSSGLAHLEPAGAGPSGLSWPELSLVFFLALFVGLVIRLVLSRSKRWERHARIPLDDQNPVDERGTTAKEGPQHHA